MTFAALTDAATAVVGKAREAAGSDGLGRAARRRQLRTEGKRAPRTVDWTGSRMATHSVHPSIHPAALAMSRRRPALALRGGQEDVRMEPPISSQQKPLAWLGRSTHGLHGYGLAGARAAPRRGVWMYGEYPALLAACWLVARFRLCRIYPPPPAFPGGPGEGHPHGESVWRGGSVHRNTVYSEAECNSGRNEYTNPPC